MRAVKHKIKPLNVEQKTKFFAVAYAYQFEKNYFSDLFSKFSRKTFKQIDDENIIFNCVNNSFISIQNQLVKSQYQSVNNLQARAWKMALKEAYDLHVRTYEAQVALLKDIIYRKIYTFYQDLDITITLLKNTLGTKQEQEQSLKNKSVKSNNVPEPSGTETDSTDIEVKQDPLLNFLTYTINYLFYNYSTFKQFEEQFYSKKFTKARIYQRIQPILQDLLDDSKAVKKEVLTQEQAKQLSQLLNQVDYELKQNKDVKNVEFSNIGLTKLLYYYCRCLVRAICKFRRFKIIQTQINPTITLDGESYKLYSKYDEAEKKNRWFLDVMSLEKGKRIKGFELTGFHHAKKIMKHKKYANLTLSFDPVEMAYYAHFTFESKAKPKKLKINKKKVKTKAKSHQTYVSKNKSNVLPTATTVGGDFGLTECFTFSDGWVAGRTQRKILKDIADNTKDDVAQIQSNSQKNYFGLEKNNPENKRNHINNSFNHNSEQHNINTNYRKRQKRYNRYLENYKYQIVNDIIHHFTTDNEYGQYAKYSFSNSENHEKLILVFEDLSDAYTNLGRTKDDKRQMNLIKGVLTLLEEKIKLYNLLIEIKYVNPAYTSQSCPSCYYVDRKNRKSRHDDFRCLHCGFTANEDVRYRALTEVVQEKFLPSKDDFIAACNIAERLSVLPNSTKLHQSKIKELLMRKHEQAKLKGSCKMFDSSNIECCST